MTDLSPRETQVLELIAVGYENLHIVNRLRISIETVRTHVKSILRKLGALNRAHAVALAYERGILQPVYLQHPAITRTLSTMRTGEWAA